MLSHSPCFYLILCNLSLTLSLLFVSNCVSCFISSLSRSGLLLFYLVVSHLICSPIFFWSHSVILFLLWLSSSFCRLFLSYAFVSFCFIALGSFHLFAFYWVFSHLLSPVCYILSHIISLIYFPFSRSSCLNFSRLFSWQFLPNFVSSISHSPVSPPQLMSSLFFSPASFYWPQFFLLFYLIPSHFISPPLSLSTVLLSFHLLSSCLVCFSSLCHFLCFKSPQKSEPVSHGVSNPSFCLWPSTVNHIYLREPNSSWKSLSCKERPLRPAGLQNALNEPQQTKISAVKVEREVGQKLRLGQYVLVNETFWPF